MKSIKEDFLETLKAINFNLKNNLARFSINKYNYKHANAIVKKRKKV